MNMSVVLSSSVERRVYMKMEKHISDLSFTATQASYKNDTIEGVVTRNTRDRLDKIITFPIYELVKQTIKTEMV
jgi:hypothetical protein